MLKHDGLRHWALSVFDLVDKLFEGRVGIEEDILRRDLTYNQNFEEWEREWKKDASECLRVVVLELAVDTGIDKCAFWLQETKLSMEGEVGLG